jgi:peptidoglycan/LPS O-acetylase OafA/YrhL
MTAFAAIGYPVAQLGLAGSRLLLSITALAVIALSAFHYRYFETPCRRLLLGSRLFCVAPTSDRYMVRVNQSGWTLSRPE